MPFVDLQVMLRRYKRERVMSSTAQIQGAISIAEEEMVKSLYINKQMSR